MPISIRRGLHSANRRICLKSSLALGSQFLLPAGVVGLVGCSATNQTPEHQGFNGRIMGTGYSVLLGARSDSGELYSNQFMQLLSELVHSELQDVDSHMSTWRSDSEISLFNASVNTDWQPISSTTTKVLLNALQTSHQSDGAFDVSIGPMVDLWGFGAGSIDLGTSNRAAIPSLKAIKNTLPRVGFEAIELDFGSNAVRKRLSNLQVDLSGIAKGHAVDRVASLLASKGVKHFLVEVGGELRSSGNKSNIGQWRVAIERPGSGSKAAFRIVELQDRSIATSGNYRNYFIEGGQRYSHSIDPRTGRSVDSELASVTVIANSTMDADALSTAMMVMGPDDAMVFAKKNKLAVQCILKSGLALEETYSDAFAAFII